MISNTGTAGVIRLLCAMVVLLVSSSVSFAPPPEDLMPKHEFRAVWVATVYNLDWPSSSKLSVADQQREFVLLLEQHRRIGMNAVIVQIRPSGDAFYASSYEPWSEWLTGYQGKAPQPYYDPLAFMIEETHKRGMEFHAWINPLRAVTSKSNAHVCPEHTSRQHKNWILTYGNSEIFNPGIPAVRQHIVEVIKDIVSRYDVDGIHFDDYFYPYPQPNLRLHDQFTFKQYPNGQVNIRDWRRQNINLLVEETSRAIKSLKPRVKLGISPFAVWRNQHHTPLGSPTTAFQTTYDDHYADVRLWLERGWIDYVAPQLYQHSRHSHIPYGPTAQWWARNSFGRHLYVGHAMHKVLHDPDPHWHNLREIGDQVRYNRASGLISGSIFYNSKNVLRNRGGLRDTLDINLFRYRAFIPPMPWLDPVRPHSPPSLTASQENHFIYLRWQPAPPAADGDTAWQYAVYRFERHETPDLRNPARLIALLPAHQHQFTDHRMHPLSHYQYVVTALDRSGNESEPCFLPNPVARLQRPKPTIPPEVLRQYQLTQAEVEHFYKLIERRTQDFISP